MTIRSNELSKIALIAQKIYLNKKYVPTSQEWTEMANALTAAVQEHNRLLQGESKQRGLTKPKQEQWIKPDPSSPYFRKHTEEGLILAHDHKRELVNGGQMDAFEKRELEAQNKRQVEEARRKREEEAAR